MLSSSKILRGLKIEGWKVYQPRMELITPGPPGKLAPSDLPAEKQAITEIKKEKETTMQTARKEAELLRKQLLEEARQEAMLLKNKAQEEGFGEGCKKGEEEGQRLQEEGQRLQEEGQRFLEKAYKERRQILDGAEKEIIRLAISLSEKLLNCRIEMDTDYILQIISGCIEPLSGDREFYLRVNPFDEETCLNNREKIMGLLKNESNLEIIADPDIPRGSCRIETETAEVEFLLKKELEILAGKLLELADQ